MSAQWLHAREHSSVVDATALGVVRPLTGEDRWLRQACIELADGLRKAAPRFGDSVLSQLRATTPVAAVDGDAEHQEGLLAMIDECAAWGLRCIERGGLSSGPLPPAVTTQARRSAASGVPLPTALARCRTGYNLAWRWMSREIVAARLPADQKIAILLVVSEAVGSMLEQVQSEVAAAHANALARNTRSREQLRAEIAERILDGATPRRDELADLGYDIDGWHTAAVATGPDAEKMMRRLQADLGCQLLMSSHGKQTVCAWLGARRKIVFDEIERVVCGRAADLDASLALGVPARGLAEMRITHLEATAAALVARYEPKRITRYADVEPIATALQDEALGDSLIETYLTPLDGMRIGGEEARRTVRALFDAAGTVVHAARALPIDRTTMHRRLKSIKEQMGFDPWEHRSEIERALRVEELRVLRDRQRAACDSRR